MCLPLDGNICFFLLKETETDRQKTRGEVEKSARVKEGNRSHWVIVQLWHRVKVLAVTSLSKHCLPVELIWVLWREGWATLGGDCSCGLVFETPTCSVRKNITLHFSHDLHLNLPQNASKHRYKRAKQCCSEDKTLSGNKSIHTHIHTRNKAGLGTAHPSLQNTAIAFHYIVNTRHFISSILFVLHRLP